MTGCVIVLKSGAEIHIPCERFHIEKERDGSIGKFTFYGTTDVELLFVNHKEIAAVYRIKASGKEGEADG